MPAVTGIFITAKTTNTKTKFQIHQELKIDTEKLLKKHQAAKNI